MKIRNILILLFIFVLALTGCKKDNNQNNKPKDPDEGKEIFGISVDKNTIPEFIDIDEFDLSMIKVIVEYSDGSTRIMDLSEDMIDEDSLEVLKKGGSKRVVVTYKEDFTATCNISTKDFGANDPKLGDSDAILMITRDKETSTLIFKSMSVEGISSIQCTFTYDSSAFSIKEEDLDLLNNGNLSVKIADNKMTIILIAKNDSLIKGETALFKLKYSGDYRAANFEVDTNSQNRVLRIKNAEILDVNDVNYFYSLK